MPQISAHIEEIIGKKPSWLIRFGISGMLLMLLTLLFVAWLVKYPDVIEATVSISTPYPPIDLVSPTNAQIEKIFISKNQTKVQKGSPLVLLKSTTSYKEVQKLKSFLEELTEEAFLQNSIPVSTDFSKLGQLQNTYNQLASYVEEYNEDIAHTPYKKRIAFLEKIIVSSSQSLKSSKNRFLLELQEKQLVDKDNKRAKKLFSKGVIAAAAYEDQEQLFLQNEMQLENSRSGLINQKTNIINLQKELTELQIQKNHFNHEIRSNIRNSAKTLHIQIEEWMNSFVISAPINGTISIFKEFNKGDYLTAGSYVLTILPIENQDLFGYGSFPVAKAGKLKINNKVIIKLHAYPYREYGSIDGFIDKISDFPIKGMYAVKIRLPNKLKTGYDKKIIFKQRLSGEAELITENRSLLSRVFSNFKYFIEKNVGEE